MEILEISEHVGVPTFIACGIEKGPTIEVRRCGTEASKLLASLSGRNLKDLKEVNKIALDFIEDVELKKAYVIARPRHNKGINVKISLLDLQQQCETKDDYNKYCRKYQELELVVHGKGKKVISNLKYVHLFNGLDISDLSFREEICRRLKRDLEVSNAKRRGAITPSNQVRKTG